MNNLDKTYTSLLQDILDNGTEKKDRTGTGTLSVFGRQIRHKMSEGFPLLTTKKMPFKTVATELIWFLRGDTNIKYLVDNNCHIWDGDAYKNYIKWWEESDDSCNLTSEQSSKWLKLIDGGLQWAPFSQEEFINKIKTNDEFANKFGHLGPIYGKQWRNWENTIKVPSINSIWGTGFEYINVHIDQIANLISELKTNPDSRRLMVNAYNIGELDQMVLPPCHYGFQVYTRELSLDERKKLVGNKTLFLLGSEEDSYDEANIPRRAISLMYNCRSQDVPLGTPFNISSYALLLEIIAKQVNMVPDQLIGNLGDCHIYLNQIDGVKEQLTREPYPLPTVKILDKEVDDISHYEISDFELIGYQSHPTIKLPLSN